MEQLYDVVMQESDVNEGFLMNALSKRALNRMSPKELFDGMLNMYDYIVDDDDIDLFLQDFPVKDRLFWKNLYDLYTKKVWSVVDVGEGFENLSEIIGNYNQMVEVTVPFRRNLRKIINESRNNKLEIKASEPQEMMAVKDELHKKVYIFTINRVSGLFKSLFRSIDNKFLRQIFEKIASK